MISLGIETSCDETAVGLVEGDRIIADITSSQLIHSQFGGVVPELASRAHIRLITRITKTALEIGRVELEELNCISATYGPGFIGSLMVGLGFAKTLSFSLSIPFVGVNHIEGHIFSIFLEYPEIKFPFLGLVVSGGHTELLLVKDRCEYKRLGFTLDDACGEAFDKVAKLLGLPYPGGLPLEELAKKGLPGIDFPRPRVDGYNFSFAGLKTAVLYYLRDHKDASYADVAYGFQEAALDHLFNKISSAIESIEVKRVGICGGVAANKRLREKLKGLKREYGVEVYIPRPELCTDNGVMIAAAGLERLKRFGPSPLSLPAEANPSLP